MDDNHHERSYDGKGRLQHYGDDMLMPVTGGGSTGDESIDGTAEEPTDTPVDVPADVLVDAAASAAGTQPGD